MIRKFYLSVLMLCFSLGGLAAEKFEITNCESLLHIGSLDSFELTANGIECARLLWDALKSNDRQKAEIAIRLYNKIIPKENYGGEYTGLLWLAEHYFFPEKYDIKKVTNPFFKEYYHFFLDNNAQVLKEYLVRKYKLQKIQDKTISSGLDRKVFLEDFILFNNPYRERWENTSEFFKRMNIPEGAIVGDIGCGPGLFSYLLSRKTGPKGKVYAMDLNKNHLNFVDMVCKKHGIKNIKTHVSGVTSTNLPADTLDITIMCSLYHIIYAEAETERNAFINSIKSTLRNNGRLIVIDNSPVTGDTLPYHSNYIAKELIIAQLKHYGFEFVRAEHFLPQRYMLEFKNKKTISRD